MSQLGISLIFHTIYLIDSSMNLFYSCNKGREEWSDDLDDLFD
jgi:hypothetical protein